MAVQAPLLITTGLRPASSLFPRLPVEIINIILAFAAESRHTCLDLCLVSSWARQIALPHLFRTLVSKDRKFQKYLVNPPYVPFDTNINAASLVKNVWMPLDYDAAGLVLDVFQNCRNITHMALSGSCLSAIIRATTPTPPGFLTLTYESRRLISGTKSDIHLTVLGTYSFNWVVSGSWQPNVRSPLYDQITHIRVETIDSFYVSGLHRPDNFSRLSHLSLPYYNAMQHDPNKLDSFLELESLQMLVIAGVRKLLQQAHWGRLEAWVWLKRTTDKRVFFVEIPGVDIQAEWEEEMRDGESVWAKASRYTAQWEARENAKVALVRHLLLLVLLSLPISIALYHQEMQAANSPVIMPRRSRRMAA